MTSTATERTVECVQCQETVWAVGCYTDPLGRRPGCEAICGACVDHLDPKEWTKKTLLGHLFADDNGYYYTSDTTKQDMVNGHNRRHATEYQGRVTLAARAGVIAHLRDTYGCRMDDDGFAFATDAWVADHVRNHETGNDLGGRLLLTDAPP